MYLQIQKYKQNICIYSYTNVYRQGASSSILKRQEFELRSCTLSKQYFSILLRPPWHSMRTCCWYTLLGTIISPFKVCFKMMFNFPKVGYVIVPWRVCVYTYSYEHSPCSKAMEVDIGGLWKMSFVFKWVIFHLHLCWRVIFNTLNLYLPQFDTFISSHLTVDILTFHDMSIPSPN